MNFDIDHDEFISLYGGRRPKPLNVSNGRVMELSSIFCNEGLSDLRFRYSDDHGPSAFDIHNAMCQRYCLASDLFRADSLTISQCNCLELRIPALHADGQCCLQCKRISV